MNFDETDFVRDLVYGYGEDLPSNGFPCKSFRQHISEFRQHPKATEKGRLVADEVLKTCFRAGDDNAYSRETCQGTGDTMSPFNPMKLKVGDNNPVAYAPFYLKNVFRLEAAHVEPVAHPANATATEMFDQIWMQETETRSNTAERAKLLGVPRDHELFRPDKWKEALHLSHTTRSIVTSLFFSEGGRSSRATLAISSASSSSGPEGRLGLGGRFVVSTNNPAVRSWSPAVLKRLYQQKAKDLVLNMTVNHTVHSCRFQPKGENTSLVKIRDDLFYFATSPDELVFVAFGRELGVIFTGRDGDTMDFTCSDERLFDNVFYPSEEIYRGRRDGKRSTSSKGDVGAIAKDRRSQERTSAALATVEEEALSARKSVEQSTETNSTGSAALVKMPSLDANAEAVRTGKFVEIKRVFEFDSTRKRMTVVCKLPGQDPPGYLRMLSKGADTGILPWCHPDPTHNIYRSHLEGAGLLLPEAPYASSAKRGFIDTNAFKEAINMTDAFAHQGWRTLCFSQRLIHEGEFNSWCQEYDALDTAEEAGALGEGRAECRRSSLISSAQEDRKFAASSGNPRGNSRLAASSATEPAVQTNSMQTDTSGVSNEENARRMKRRIKEKKTAMLQKLEEVEQGFEYLGCTAIEDILQDDLCETLTSFRKAGITTWVLTGDKVETGIAIALSCGLIHSAMTQILMRQELVEELLDIGTEALSYHMAETSSLVDEMGGPINCVLVLDGIAIRLIWERPVLLPAFQTLLTKFNTVLACRVTPQQKAEMTMLAQLQGFRTKDLEAITDLNHPDVFEKALKIGKRVLAIGDGANDVPMLEQANISVGIRGKEGGLASQVADMSVRRFKDLRRLIFVYGHDARRTFSTVVKLALQRAAVHLGPTLYLTFIETHGDVFNFIPEFMTTFCVNCFSPQNQTSLASSLGLERNCDNLDDTLSNGKFYNVHCFHGEAPLAEPFSENEVTDMPEKTKSEDDALAKRRRSVSVRLGNDHDPEELSRAANVECERARAKARRDFFTRKHNRLMFAIFDYHNRQSYTSTFTFLMVFLLQFWQGFLLYLCFWVLLRETELGGNTWALNIRFNTWGSCTLVVSLTFQAREAGVTYSMIRGGRSVCTNSVLTGPTLGPHSKFSCHTPYFRTVSPPVPAIRGSQSAFASFLLKSCARVFNVFNILALRVVAIVLARCCLYSNASILGCFVLDNSASRPTGRMVNIKPSVVGGSSYILPIPLIL